MYHQSPKNDKDTTFGTCRSALLEIPSVIHSGMYYMQVYTVPVWAAVV